MRTRDEVLREFLPESEWDDYDPQFVMELMADRIRELEAQLTLPPIREKFVRVSDELVAELKAAPSKPVTVAIVENGNELHMTFTEAQRAASEPVAWAIVDRDGVTMDVRMTWAEAREHSIDGDTLRPLVFGDHPTTPTRGSDE